MPENGLYDHSCEIGQRLNIISTGFLILSIVSAESGVRSS
jgi:hypothetical protein